LEEERIKSLLYSPPPRRGGGELKRGRGEAGKYKKEERLTNTS